MKQLMWLLLLSGVVVAQPFSCPAYNVDMMDYFTMSYPARASAHMGPGSSTSNDIYSYLVPDTDDGSYATSGIFFWLKSQQGWPWDVKSYDGSYIYDRSTELNWSDPTAYKRFVHDLPLSPRCIRWGQAGPVVRTPAARNDFKFYKGCAQFDHKNLGNVQTQITAPYSYSGGNLGTVKARDLIYLYSCDGSYHCNYLEVFRLAEYFGLIDWHYYQWGNNRWNSIQESPIDELRTGTTEPYVPCPGLYQ